MDEPRAFENQLGQVLQGAAGPSRPTDVAAMVRAATTPPSSPWARVLGATRLAVAGVVVALFGGFLVLALLTGDGDRETPIGASPSTTPAATDGLRSRLETETVAPGIVRVIDDGAEHDLSHVSDDPESRGFDRIALGPSEAVWVHRPSGELFRLGQEGTHAATPYFEGGISWLDFTSQQSLAARNGSGDLVEVVPDTGSAAAWSLPLSDTERAWYSESGGRLAKTAPDGTWASHRASDLAAELLGAVRERDFVSYPDDIWDVIGENMGEPCAIAMTSDGTPWAGACGAWGLGWGGGALARYGDAGWEAVQPLADTEDAGVIVSDVIFLAPGPDDSLWVVAYTTTIERLRDAWDLAPAKEEWQPGTLVGPVLMRLHDGEWSVFPLADVAGEDDILDNSGAGIDAIGLTDLGGRLWLGAGDHRGVDAYGDLSQLPGKAALLSFDGTTVRWHPEVGAVRDIEMSAEGSLWVAGEDGLFIIDPDTAHATSAASAPGPRYAVTDGVVDGADVEQIAPGVVRLAGFGDSALPEAVFTLAYGHGPAIYSSIAVGADGTVAFSRGEQSTVAADDVVRALPLPSEATDIDVAKDGTIWHASSLEEGPALFGSTGATSWSQASSGAMRGPTSIEVHPDGTVIGAWRDAQGDTVVGRLWEEDWSAIGTPIPGAVDAMHVSDGEVWVVQGDSLLNADWEGRAWRDLGELPTGTLHVDVGTNGVPSVLVRTGADLSVGRYFGDTWTFEDIALEDGYTAFPTEVASQLDDAFGHGGPFEEAGDGSLWFALAGPPDAGGRHTCAGLAHLVDGRIETYLDGECIGAHEVVVDGSVWVQTTGSIRDGFPIYVIRP